MDEFMLGSGVVTRAIYRKKRQTWCGREAYVYTLFQTGLQFLVVIGGLLLSRLISRPAVVQLHI